MSKLVDVFPTLAGEVAQALRDEGHEALAQQIDGAAIARVTFDPDANAGYIYLEPSRALNFVERNIVGVRHGKTIPLVTQFWAVVDTDNFDRLACIEILDPRELRVELARCATG